MKRKLLYTLAALVLPLLMLSCGGTRQRGATGGQAYFSGSFTIDQGGAALFTDCASRATLRVEPGGVYETVRRLYDREGIQQGQPLRIEFSGEVVRRPTVPAGNVATRIAPDLPSVRIDTLLSWEKGDRCLSDFIVPGIYRSDEEEPVMLRLRPDYTYTVERFLSNGTDTLARGEWRRSSVLTIELRPGQTGPTTSYQIVPARDSLAETGPGGTSVFVKQWL